MDGGGYGQDRESPATLQDCGSGPTVQNSIQNWAEMIHGAQIVETHISEAGSDEKIASHVKGVEELVARRRSERGLKLVKYIYEKPAVPGSERKRRPES